MIIKRRKKVEHTVRRRRRRLRCIVVGEGGKFTSVAWTPFSC